MKADLGERDVARFLECLGHRHPRRASVAEGVAEVGQSIRGLRQVQELRVRPSHVIGLDISLERRRRRDELAGRTRKEQLVFRQRDERPLGVGGDRLPCVDDVGVGSRRDGVRVVCGVRHQGEHVAGRGIDRHDRAGQVAECLVGGFLQVGHDRRVDGSALAVATEDQIGEGRDREVGGVARQVGVRGLLESGTSEDARVVAGQGSVEGAFGVHPLEAELGAPLGAALAAREHDAVGRQDRAAFHLVLGDDLTSGVRGLGLDVVGVDDLHVRELREQQREQPHEPEAEPPDAPIHASAPSRST